MATMGKTSLLAAALAQLHTLAGAVGWVVKQGLGDADGPGMGISPLAPAVWVLTHPAAGR